jgi:hypothetical protein
MTLDVIRSQPKLACDPYVFSGRGGGPFNSFSERKAELERAMPESTDRWVLHDLRRTCRKLMTRAKVARRGIRSRVSRRPTMTAPSISR